MRRSRKSIGWLVPAAVALLCLPAAALAEHAMTFRQLPPESLEALAHGQRQVTGGPHGVVASGSIEGKQFEVRVDSTGGVNIHLPAGSLSDDSSDTSESHSDSDHSAGRETTGEIVRFGSDIEVPARQVVTGDVVSMGGSVRVRGTVKGSVTSMGGDVTLGSTSRVDGDVVCLGGTLHEAPGASVGGQRVTAPRVPGGHMLLPMLSVVGTGVKVVTHVMGMVLMLLIAFVIIKLAPGRTQHALDMVRNDGAMSFMVGLLAWGLLIPSLVVLALAVAVLAITLIGIPLAIVVLFGYAALLVLATVWGCVVGYALLGGQLKSRFAAPTGEGSDLLGAAIWGVVALYALRIAGDLLHIVPLFGFFGGLVRVLAVGATLVLGTLGAGALIRSEYERRTVQSWWQQRSNGRRGRRDDPFPPPPPTPGVTPTADAGAPPPPAPQAPPSEPETPQPPPIV